MKKRSLIVILAVLCIATSCFVSSTFAKYTSEVTGTQTATVATWKFTQEGTTLVNGVTDSSVAVKLFDTILDTDTSAADEQVSAGVIAPGTKGAFDLKIKNESQVAATYTVTVVITDASDATVTVITTNVTNDTGTLTMGGEATANVSWEWAFGGDSATDMALIGQTLTATVTVTFTQVD